MIEKNKSYLADVEDLTLEGSGVCRIDGFAVFVPMTAVGDRIRVKIVKVQKQYAFGIVEQIITPAPTRCQPDCAVYHQCGGCNFRHITYTEELRLKEKVVRDAFQRIGGFSLEPESIVGAEEENGYRNKVQLPLGLDQKGRVAAGFFAKRSHRLIPADACRIQDPHFEPVVRFVVDFVQKNKIPLYQEETHTGLLRHIFLRRGRATAQMMLCLVVTEKRVPKLSQLVSALTDAFPELVSIYLNVNPARTNVILGKKYLLLAGEEKLEDRLLDVSLSIAPAAFYQVNHAQTERLYQLAYEYAHLKKDDLLLDLYCGIGSIGLCAYEKVREVIGVEVIRAAVESATHNAQKNGMERTRFFCDDAKGAAKRFAEEGLKPDVVFVDPPRKGCEQEVLESLVAMSPERIVMISCNPATAARDCKVLVDMGYHLQRYRGVDLFPRTGHIETVALLSLKTGTPKIEITMEVDSDSNYSPEEKATYQKIKEYVKDKYGLSVTNLYIAQIKDKCGLDKRLNYNLPKSENAKKPKCTEEKEIAILDAFKHFGLV